MSQEGRHGLSEFSPSESLTRVQLRCWTGLRSDLWLNWEGSASKLTWVLMGFSSFQEIRDSIPCWLLVGGSSQFLVVWASLRSNFTKPAKESVCRESASTIGVTVLRNMIVEVTSPLLCLTLLLEASHRSHPLQREGNYTRAWILGGRDNC